MSHCVHSSFRILLNLFSKIVCGLQSVKNGSAEYIILKSICVSLLETSNSSNWLDEYLCSLILIIKGLVIKVHVGVSRLIHPVWLSLMPRSRLSGHLINIHVYTSYIIPHKPLHTTQLTSDHWSVFVWCISLGINSHITLTMVPLS